MSHKCVSIVFNKNEVAINEAINAYDLLYQWISLNLMIWYKRQQTNKKHRKEDTQKKTNERKKTISISIELDWVCFVRVAVYFDLLTI